MKANLMAYFQWGPVVKQFEGENSLKLMNY